MESLGAQCWVELTRRARWPGGAGATPLIGAGRVPFGDGAKVFHPCKVERARFHVYKELYTTVSGGGLPDELASHGAIEAVAKDIFRHRSMKRCLAALQIPMLRDRVVRWFLVEHGACGWRKFRNTAPRADDGTVADWLRRRRSTITAREYAGVVAYLQKLKTW